jgi:oligoribonuclease
VYKKRPAKAETHRALADVRESIAELRYYRESMLRAPETHTTEVGSGEQLA